VIRSGISVSEAFMSLSVTLEIGAKKGSDISDLILRQKLKIVEI